MKDIKNIDDIKIFVDTFYTKVGNNELLAPIFALRIANDDWPRHLNRMYSFWNSVLFAGKKYKGNPFSKHVDLPITPLHFETWVALFKETIDENFKGPKAEDAKRRVDQMATMFMSKLEYLKNNPTYKSIM